MRYYIIAGEASGDLHASNLMKELKIEDSSATYRCWGGDLMQSAGGEIVKHYRELAFMGFWEVAKNIRTILANMKFCKSDILQWKPDVLVLVDYPGFNLRIAKWAKENNIRVFYYISPQIWAWKENRVHAIKATVERMFVIMPFEQDFYKKYDYAVDFVGHPLLDVVHNYQANPSFLVQNKLDKRPIIALLPGSRKQEVSLILATMLEVVEHFPKYQFVIAAAPSFDLSFYQKIIGNKKVGIVSNQTYDLLSHAKAALVASGTATLETALFNVPQVVCYRGSFITYHIAKSLIKIKYIALVNLVLDRPFVKELIQNDFNKTAVIDSLSALFDDNAANEIEDGYRTLKNKLGKAGASKKAAKLMVKYLKE